MLITAVGKTESFTHIVIILFLTFFQSLLYSSADMSPVVLSPQVMFSPFSEVTLTTMGWGWGWGGRGQVIKWKDLSRI